MAEAFPPDNDSDYGWDLSLDEEELLTSLDFATHPSSTAAALHGSQPAAAGPTLSQTTELIPSFAGAGAALASDPATAALYEHKSHRDISDPGPTLAASYEDVALAANISGVDSPGPGQGAGQHIPVLPGQELEISYPDLSNALSALEPATAEGKPDREPVQLQSQQPQLSPLVRFRTYPKKPFSVSDLTAGAWCELQYAYTLTLLPGGKRTRTAAMKGGSKVHKELEDEVHVTVQIEVTKREDAFALKLWNIIQGLRTLREKGLTRELEVWGLVDGHVVNGIIDGLSYDNPDPQFEEEMLDQSKKDTASQIAPDQAAITEFYASTQPRADVPTPQRPRKIYLTDVKTRASNTLPKGAAVRPTKIQLFLYHRFLAEMASGKLDFLRVIRRYGHDPDEPFSDSFLAQIGELHDEIFYDAPTSSAPEADVDMELSGTIPYQTLRSLLSLVSEEFRLTFPLGADSLGKLVTVEYRARPREPQQPGEEVEEEGGRLIGTNVLPVDDAVLDEYIGSYMQWWRGERPARGVDIEEFYKCGFCEFAERCDRRQSIHEELTQLARARVGPRRKRSATPTRDTEHKRVGGGGE